MNEYNAIEILTDVKNTLEKYSITFWLDCGTLLGAIRDGKMISWDHDIDIGMWFKDINKINEAMEEFKDKGYTIQYRHINGDTIPVGLMIGDIEVEFLILNPKDDEKHYYNCIMPIHFVGKFFDYILWCMRLNSPWVKKNYGSCMPFKLTSELVNICNIIPEKFRDKFVRIIENIYFKIDSVIIESAVPVKYFKVLKKITFYNLQFNVPYDTEEYLEFRFGDWNTPTKHYYGGAVIRKYRYGDKKVDDKHLWGV